jgi:hypothetical protein
LRFNCAGFVVNPDVDVEWDSVAFESIRGKEESDEFRDLQGDTILVREFCSTGADDDGVTAGSKAMSNESKHSWISGPGFVKVDGDGEGFHTGLQVLLV